MTISDREASRSSQLNAELSSLQADVKLILLNPNTGERLAFGPGVAELCIGVKEHGSLKAAAAEMGMAYSKAWKIIGEAEESLQIQLVLRQAPKGCTLTEAGEQLLAGYLELAEDISKYAEFRLQRVFPRNAPEH